jgi:hypothetical protein
MKKNTHHQTLFANKSGSAGGGDGFPNSRTTVAAALAQNTQLYTHWTQFDEIPDTQAIDMKAADTLFASVAPTLTHPATDCSPAA